MSIRIRTRTAGGQEHEELYATEAIGLSKLEQNLNVHRIAGHKITRSGDTYTVTDSKGAFVQESIVVPSF